MIICQFNILEFKHEAEQGSQNVPYLNSWKGRYKIPYPTGGYVFLPRAPKAQGEEILVPSHGVRYLYLPAQLLR